MAGLYRLILQSGVGNRTLLALSALAVFSSFLAVLPPHFLGAIVNAAAETGQRAGAVYSPVAFLDTAFAAVSGYFSLPPLLLFSLLFFIFSCLTLVVRNVFVVCVSICADKFIRHARKASLEAVIRAEKKESARYTTGDVAHRVMTDTKQLEYLVGPPLYVLCSDVFDLLWVSFFLALLDWKILAMLACAFPPLFVLSRRAGRAQRVLAKKAQETEAECTGFVQRVFAGVDAVKAYQAEKKEGESFKRLLDGIFALEVKSSIKLGSFFCIEGALRAAGTILVIAYAAQRATAEPVFAGAIPVLLLYTQRFYSPLTNWARFYQVIQKSIVSLDRVSELIALRAEAPAGPSVSGQNIFPLVIDGSVALDDGRRVSLRLRMDEPGLIVLRGRSGVGKTQFTKSLLSLGNAFTGELRVGGCRLDGENLLPARTLFAHAAQDSLFLPGTIADNLAYPEEGGAIDRARCRELLDALDLGSFSPDDRVLEYGRNLSLGEGRRIILGRALYSTRPILLLDEIDANVDAETRKKIYDLVSREKERRPVFMITHANTVELSALEHEKVVFGGSRTESATVDEAC